MFSNSKSAGVPNRSWIAALLVLCGAIVLYGAFYAANAIADPAYLAGERLVYALLFWAIFHVLFLRSRGATTNLTAFAMIFVALFAAGIVSAARHSGQANKAISSIQQEWDRLAASTDSEGRAAQIERVKDLQPTAQGEFGEIERLVKQYIDGFIAQRNAYLLELDEIGWGLILDPGRLKQDRLLSESKSMVERASSIVEKYEKATAQLLARTKERIGSLNLSPAAKRELVAGFEAGMAKAQPLIDEQWRIEKEVVAEFEGIVLALATSDGWTVEGQQILFANDGELARFNSHIKAIEELARRQDEIRRESTATVDRNMDEMKSAIR